MLLWQLKNARNRHLLWLKLGACSCALHLFFMGLIFFGYRDGISTHKLIVHSHNPNAQVTIVLMPTARTAHAQVGKQMTAQNIVTSNAQPTARKKAATQLAQLKPAPVKEPPKKAALAKAKPIKKAPIKTVAAKIEKPKPAQPKTVQAKPVPEHKKELAVAPKPVEKKIEQPKVVAEQKKLPATLPALAQQPALAQHIDIQPEQTPIAHNQNDNPMHIEVPYHQAREFYQQEALRKEISRHWNPPHGIPDTCACEITICVGKDGVVTDGVITQSSGILMYDVSARATIFAMNLPRWTWGTSFAVTFKP